MACGGAFFARYNFILLPPPLFGCCACVCASLVVYLSQLASRLFHSPTSPPSRYISRPLAIMSTSTPEELLKNAEKKASATSGWFLLGNLKTGRGSGTLQKPQRTSFASPIDSKKPATLSCVPPKQRSRPAKRIMLQTLFRSQQNASYVSSRVGRCSLTRAVRS